MTLRVGHLVIPPWNRKDLVEIPNAGFPKLNTKCAPETIAVFLDECFQSPHLMQDFCLRLCLENLIYETTDTETALSLQSEDKTFFFGKVGRDASKPAFDRLARGPRQRSDRMQRLFKDGTRADIYIAVLRALERCTLQGEITYEDIRVALRDIMAENVPQSQEVSRVLIKMTEIARKEIMGEPVLDWDEENKVLHIVDPFFAFYLRWGQKG